MRDDAVLRRALPLGRGLGPKYYKVGVLAYHLLLSVLPYAIYLHWKTHEMQECRTKMEANDTSSTESEINSKCTSFVHVQNKS